MIYIEDGRSSFYQWDIGQRLIVDNPDVTEVHFSNNLKDPALICEVYDEGSIRYANVPNILLQQPNTLLVHGCCEECVRESLRIRVIVRAKPADYVYTETEVRSFDALQQRAETAINVAESSAASAEAAADRAEAAADGASEINDDVISSDSTWSSEGTVNRFCVEFKTTGEIVACKPVAGSELRVVTRIEPIQSGSGTPSPDNIRPISGCDVISLEVNGKSYAVQPGATVYKGEYDWRTGKLTTENYALIIFDGTENFTLGSKPSNANAQTFALEAAKVNNKASAEGNWQKSISNMFQVESSDYPNYASLPRNGYYWNAGAGPWRFAWGDPGATVEEFKAFLQANPLQVLVPITPATTTSTFVGRTITAQDGENLLVSNGGALEVSGKAFPTYIIELLEARIAALENAVVDSI